MENEIFKGTANDKTGTTAPSCDIINGNFKY
jgi:hypothetical protein